MREVCKIGDLGLRQGINRGAMKYEAAVRRDRVLYRQARQLVAERDVRRACDQHAAGQAFIDSVSQLAGERLQEPRLDLAGNDGGRVQQPGR